MSGLQRTLGLKEVIFFGVGSILGAGIYTLFGKVAGYSGNLTWLAFLMASFTALLTAFSYAELASMYPDAGAEYVYITEAFGKRTGIISGIVVAVTSMISGATVSLGFAGYFRELLGVSLLFASLLIVISMFLLNVIGIKQSSLVNIVLTIVEAGGLIFIIYCCFPLESETNISEVSVKGYHGVLTGAALAFFACIGFDKAVKLAEETKKPETIIPRALFISNAVVTVIYLAVAICAVTAVSYSELAASESSLTLICEKKFGRTGVVIISVIALFSTSNTILSNMLSSSRVLYDMARASGLPEIFSRVSNKRHTPVNALWLVLIVMSAFTFIGEIETVARITTLLIFITFIILNLTVILLRFMKPEKHRAFRVPGTVKGVPLICILGIIFTLVLMGYNIYAWFI